jgi:hypothetical protein
MGYRSCPSPLSRVTEAYLKSQREELADRKGMLRLAILGTQAVEKTRELLLMSRFIIRAIPYPISRKDRPGCDMLKLRWVTPFVI